MGTKQKQLLNRISNIVGLLASFGGMVLTIIFLYFNPYDKLINSGTVEIVYATLFAPALFTLILLIFKKHRLMFRNYSGPQNSQHKKEVQSTPNVRRFHL